MHHLEGTATLFLKTAEIEKKNYDALSSANFTVYYILINKSNVSLVCSKKRTNADILPF